MSAPHHRFCDSRRPLSADKLPCNCHAGRLLLTQPCRLCGNDMVEGGDGWCSGEPGSPAGFYSAHWACVHSSNVGRYSVEIDGRGRRYTTLKRAREIAEQYAGWNRGTRFTVTDTETGSAVFSALLARGGAQ